MLKHRHVTYGFLAALIVVVLLGLLAWALSSSRPTPSGSLAGGLAQVTFTGYSNAPDGRVFAWFAITNPTDYKILNWPATIELRYGGIWRDLPPSGPAKVLAPHAHISVNFAKPEGSEAWRVTTYNGLAPSTLKPLIADCLRLLAWASKGIQNWINQNSSIAVGPSTSEPRRIEELI